jgi:archaellum component FlaC
MKKADEIIAGPAGSAVPGPGRELLAERLAHALGHRLATARPGRFLLFAWLFLGLVLLLKPSPAGYREGEVHLLDGSPLPKLNNTSAKRHEPVSVREPLILAKAGGENHPPELTIEPEAPVLLTPPALEKGYPFANSHQGESPMMSNWKALGVPLILAGAMAASDAQAQDVAKPADTSDLKKQIEEINKKLPTIDQLKSSVLAIDKDLGDEIKGRREHSATVDSRLEQIQNDMTALKSQMEQIHRDLDAARSRPATQISSFQSAAPAVSHVRLANTYVDTVRIVVNGKPYDVAPGSTMLADAVPAGNFTYEVIGVQAPQTRTIAANETFTISVHP